jgi:hypothetical protein
MVPNAPLEETVLVTGELDCDEIKKRIKSALESIPSDATLDVHPPMRPNDGFIEMVSAPPPLFPSSFFPWLFCVPFPLPDPRLGRLQGNLCLVPDFNTPLLEDTIERARNQAHTEGVKKKKNDEEKKKKKAGRAKRKEECEKCQKMEQ